MRNAFLIVAATLFGAAVAPASAMPIAPAPTGDANITLAANGCGPGWYRGPYGACHPMGYYGAPVYAAPVYRPYPYYGGYYRHCWWRGGVRVCN